ncbi:MAG: HD domain-containing phosphohydrolase, partial [Syntrophales bacterium]|nr:HD domain-containing phosphohydrolase [Syntrophales bacterium]
REYERHPVRGQAAIDAIEAFRSVGAIIRHHHESVNGMGFPDRLSKYDIPLGSRVIALADAADRLSTGIRRDDKNIGRKVLSLLNAQLDKTFDRDILPFMEQFILERIVAPSLQDATGEVEISPEILVPGMILSRDIKSGTGIMLLAAGTVLDRKAISTLQRFNKIDPFEKVYVQRNREPLINV